MCSSSFQKNEKEEVDDDDDTAGRTKKNCDSDNMSYSDSDEDDVNDERRPARNVRTITTGCFKSYYSALKFWHEHEDALLKKIGYKLPVEVDDAFQQTLGGLKRCCG